MTATCLKTVVEVRSCDRYMSENCGWGSGLVTTTCLKTVVEVCSCDYYMSGDCVRGKVL